MGSDSFHDTQTRNLGLDICRILSMLGIVMLHVLNQGGVLKNSENLNHSAYWVEYYISVFAMCSVDVFAMMSGYFGYGKHKQKSFRLFELISSVFFYSFIITMIVFILKPSMYGGIKTLLQSLFPPIAGRYWYITCFVPILIFQPIINRMIDSLTVKQHGWLLVLLIVLFSVLPSVTRVDFFVIKSGYSCVWLLICYVIGSFLRRSITYAKLKRYKGRVMLVFLGSSIFLMIANMCTKKLLNMVNYMVTYDSPIILFMSITVIAIFDGIRVTRGQKIIMYLSSMSFDVYLIHSHILIFDNYMKNAFVWINEISTLLIPIMLLLSIASIYLTCSILGLCRKFIYRFLKINTGLNKLSFRVDRLVNSIICE